MHKNLKNKKQTGKMKKIGIHRRRHEGEREKNRWLVANAAEYASKKLESKFLFANSNIAAPRESKRDIFFSCRC
uniref:Uncharacterized protein n=1 Tax=Panagrolaimus sp. PS1159 TaxID=55785 RepID=A0AC35G313_9BILA